MLLVIILAIQNAEPIPIKLYFWDVNVSIAFLVVLMLLIGTLLGIFASYNSGKKNTSDTANKENNSSLKEENK